MTREIEFRAWTDNLKDGGEMYYQRENEYFSPTFSPAGYGLLNPSLKIMQYTGLKYQNGKKIFEGDIVEVRNVGLFKVFFENGTFLIKALGYNMPLYQYIPEFVCGVPLYQYIYQCKFIGNIYENPELLGGKYE